MSARRPPRRSEDHTNRRFLNLSLSWFSGFGSPIVETIGGRHRLRNSFGIEALEELGVQRIVNARVSIISTDQRQLFLPVVTHDEFCRAPARRFDGAARSFPTPAPSESGVPFARRGNAPLTGIAMKPGYPQAIETTNESARIKF
jgi:hypothetical protein